MGIIGIHCRHDIILGSQTYRGPKAGQHFLAKTFQGGTEKDLLTMLKQNFRQVIHVKPASSRAESVEMFLLAKGFKGRKPKDEDTEDGRD